MADIFLAYSRPNKKKAASFKKAFTAEGLTVFDDQSIPTGADWRRHIQTQLAACRLVVVFWSRTSVKSNFVTEEADSAKAKGKLFPLMITECEIPYGFRSYQTKKLTAWRGARDSPVWVELMAEIRALLKGRKTPAPLPTSHRPRQTRKSP